MKKTIILTLIAVALLGGTAAAQQKLTARRLFMLLPTEYVGGETAAKRATALAFPKSVKADFLTFMMSPELVPANLAGSFAKPEGLGDMRVFRGKSGAVVVGLRYQIGDSNEPNPTVDTTKIVTLLLEYKAGKWTDVTESLLPRIASEEVRGVLAGFPDTKDVGPADFWVETQVAKDRAGLQLVARVKGSDAVTPLKFFKWNGTSFVAAD